MTIKPWQYFILPFFVCLCLNSCSSNSENTDPVKSSKVDSGSEQFNQEGWSEEDRQKAIEEIEQVREELEAKLGDKTDAFIECYLSKIEIAYPNLSALENNTEKAVEISTNCAEELMKIEE